MRIRVLAWSGFVVASLGVAQTPARKQTTLPDAAAKLVNPGAVGKPAIVKPSTAAAPAVRRGLPAPNTQRLAFPQTMGAVTASVVTGSSGLKVEDVSRRISFDTRRFWSESRWYAIGHWVTPDTIRWIGGSDMKVQFPRVDCTLPENGDSLIVRPQDLKVDANANPDKKKQPINREVLNKRGWVAIEGSPNVAEENFEIRSNRYKEMPECVSRVRINYGWKGQKTEVKPLLFLKPTDYFFGYEITLYAPEKPERANIQLDLMIGYWNGSFPNAKVSATAAAKRASDQLTTPTLADYPAAKKKIHLAPAAVSRGEWLVPFEKRIGLTLGIEQSLLSFGGVDFQRVLISDWFMGAFFQQILPGLDGLQFRVFMKYHEHLTDQGTVYETMLDVNRQAKNLIVGSTLNHYFGRRWLLGADFEYGFPNAMAGRGVDQSYMAYYGRVGFRLTTFLLMIAEGGFRNYKAAGYPTEKLLQANGGIRLEL